MAPRNHAPADEPLVPITTQKLIEGISVPCDIFIKDGAKTISLFNRGMLFNAAARTLLQDRGLSEVLIRASDVPRLGRYQARDASAPTLQPEVILFPEYFAQKEAHYPIDKTLMLPGSEVAFNIYSLGRLSLDLLVEASEQAPRRLEASLLATDAELVIRQSDIPRYQAYVRALVTSKDLGAKERAKVQTIAIKENSKLIIKDLIDNPRSGEKIKESVVAVNKMVDCILDNREALSELISIKSHDYYTYTHSVNVAALSVGLGIAAGLKRADLESLGIGTMLHDLGKSAIPLDILNKPGKLSDEEFSIMKTHVIESEKILRAQKEIPEAALVAAVQHHEKISGKGYPYGLAGSEVTQFGRIAAIADCYDAMTTERCYKPALTPFHSLSIIVKETGNEGHFDPDFVAIFIKMLGKMA